MFIPNPEEIVWPSSVSTAPSSSSLSQAPSVLPSQNVPNNFPLFSWGWLGVTVLALLIVIVVMLVFVVFYLRKRNVSSQPELD